MKAGVRQQRLDTLLAACRGLWHPQPFREPRPAWCGEWPALAAELLALPDAAADHLADDGDAALVFLARYLPEIAELAPLATLPARTAVSLPDYGPFWARDIPGRKRAQIEAFAAAAQASGRPLLDWCGGKGHLGRLLARHWQVAAETVDIDPVLCEEGRDLACRADVDHTFRTADALAPATLLPADHHVVALHACGDLHRTLLRRATEAGAGALDLAPCCYHRGVAEHYQPLSGPLATALSRDDTRLAVTETVTASPRQARRRDRDMAWKLGFDAWRRLVRGDDTYRPFKPVPAAWLAGSFGDFLGHLAAREGLPPPRPGDGDAFEGRGWQRQRETMRLSIVRHAFRRPLEIWLALDLAVFLEAQGYTVHLGSFCPRPITPRNLLLSARRSS